MRNVTVRKVDLSMVSELAEEYLENFGNRCGPIGVVRPGLRLCRENGLAATRGTGAQKLPNRFLKRRVLSTIKCCAV